VIAPIGAKRRIGGRISTSLCAASLDVFRQYRFEKGLAWQCYRGGNQFLGRAIVGQLIAPEGFTLGKRLVLCSFRE
jgi:hypothetical protein